MKEAEVPQAWVDAAVTGPAPSPDRHDARYYLARAYEAIREDLLWEAASHDLYIMCACGEEWPVDSGPDTGHGRKECPPAPDALIRIKGRYLRLYNWRLTPLAAYGQVGPRWQLSGVLREFSRDWPEDLYNGVVLERAELPGRYCPTGQRVQVESSGDGTGRMFIKVEWNR